MVPVLLGFLQAMHLTFSSNEHGQFLECLGAGAGPQCSACCVCWLHRGHSGPRQHPLCVPSHPCRHPGSSKGDSLTPIEVFCCLELMTRPIVQHPDAGFTVPICAVSPAGGPTRKDLEQVTGLHRPAQLCGGGAKPGHLECSPFLGIVTVIWLSYASAAKVSQVQTELNGKIKSN